MSKVQEIRNRANGQLKKSIKEREAQFLAIRKSELANRKDACLICNNAPGACQCLAKMMKSEQVCADCDKLPCVCPGKDEVKPVELKIKDSGSGDPKGKKLTIPGLKKAGVPMAKPPGGGGAGTVPMSKPKAPTVGGGMTKAETPAKKSPGDKHRQHLKYVAEQANAASKQAQENPTAENHQRASILHDTAAKARTSVATVEYHQGQAADHRGEAGMIRQKSAGMTKSVDWATLDAMAEKLAKAIPHLGGRDKSSKDMMIHASTGLGGMGSAAAPEPKAPKLSQEDQSRRQAQYADFTPAGAFSASGAGSDQGGAMKPMSNIKPAMTPAAPKSSIGRFSAALHGTKMGKAEKSPENEASEKANELTSRPPSHGSMYRTANTDDHRAAAEAHSVAATAHKAAAKLGGNMQPYHDERVKYHEDKAALHDAATAMKSAKSVKKGEMDPGDGASQPVSTPLAMSEEALCKGCGKGKSLCKCMGKAEKDSKTEKAPKVKVKYHTCPECEANFQLPASSDGTLPPHDFLRKPCAGSGGKGE